MEVDAPSVIAGPTLPSQIDAVSTDDGARSSAGALRRRPATRQLQVEVTLRVDLGEHSSASRSPAADELDVITGLQIHIAV